MNSKQTSSSKSFKAVGVTDVPTDLNIQRQAMLKALWDKDEAKAIDLLKAYLCDCLGRVTV